MMKAKRSYKEDIAQKERWDKKDSQVEAQCEEFETFLRNAIAKPKPFQFLVDMHEKLIIQGHPLSENMENAIRKCMEREKEWEAKKASSEAGDYPTITLKVKPFIMKDLGIDSRIITGKVKAESGKAWLIEGHADMLENVSFCVRCMRQLTEPASQITGMGSTCAEKAGVPYDSQNILNASKKEREKVRKQFIKKLHKQRFERWIPKAQAEVFDQTI